MKQCYIMLILLLLSLTIALSGCETKEERINNQKMTEEFLKEMLPDEEHNVKENNAIFVSEWIDKETGVHYLVYNDNLYPRYDSNGNIMITDNSKKKKSEEKLE